jgi:hypothetical protein
MGYAELPWPDGPPPPMFRGTANGLLLPAGAGTGVITIRCGDSQPLGDGAVVMLLATSYAASAGLSAEIIPAQIGEFIRSGTLLPRPDGTYDFCRVPAGQPGS